MSSKLTDLEALVALTTDDIFYVVNDPGGTPVSRKITYGNVLGNVLKVGNPISGVTANSVLYADSSGNLAEKNPEFTFNGTDTLTVPNLTASGTVGAGTVTGANVTSGADPGHTHTSTSLPDVESLTTSLTSGSVVFSDGTNLAQNNPGFTYDGASFELDGVANSTLAKFVDSSIVALSELFIVSTDEDHLGNANKTGAVFVGTAANPIFSGGHQTGVYPFQVHSNATQSADLTALFEQHSGNFNVATFKNTVGSFTIGGTNLSGASSLTTAINFVAQSTNRDMEFKTSTNETVMKMFGGTGGETRGLGLTTDGYKYYAGAANDAEWFFDSNSLYIVANAVTSTDDMRLIARSVIKETADTGWVASVNADELVLENTDHCGMTIFAGADKIAAIYMGDSNVDVGGITYNNSGNILTLRTLDFNRFILDHLAWKVIVPSLQLGSDSTAGTLTDATRKLGRIFSPHFTNAERPINVFLCDSDGTDNIIGFGDGSANGVKATEIRFSVAANDTTQGTGAVDNSNFKIITDGFLAVGTEKILLRDTELSINSADDGHLDVDADISIDINAPQIDMESNVITDLGGLHFNSATELTISSGVVTVTQGHHSIDTEADASNDDLDTMDGGNFGEILLILPKDDDRTVRIRHGIGNIFLKHQVESKSFSFSSPSGSSGIFYSGGYYNWTTTDANLNQASLSVTHSASNVASACHIGIVAGGAGIVDTGIVKLTVAGTTVDDDGNRAASQTVTLVADITTLSLNNYVETTEKWIGQVTIALATASGSPVNFNLDINYGCSKYEDFGNQAFTVTVLECVGLAGANDTGFNLKLFYHSTTGWTYAASGFVPGGTVLASMNTDYGAEQNLANGESFAYKRVNLNTDISGDNGEGLVLEITTSANKAVEIMDIHFGVHTAPNFAYLATTKQHLIFMKHGSNWLEL